MDSMQAFGRGQAARAAGARSRVFDWNKAARRIVEAGARQAGAGLASDWEYTGGTIFRDGEPNTESYTYLSSLWAMPELELDGVLEDCWLWEDETEWGEGTKWPDSALEILRGGKDA